MIIFKKLTYKNFLGVGNQPVSIELNKHKTTLIHGTNGSGKSTILDALCYSLYGKPFRKINIPQLINSQNNKGLEVSVEFSIGKDDYEVHRGLKPRLFEIIRNGEILDAKAADKDNQATLEQNILKLSYRSFTQIVILGSSSYVPFMQLPAQGRRDCVEEFLDIKVFSTMAILAKERFRSLKEQAASVQRDISTVQYKLEIQNDRIEEIQSQTQERINDLLAKITDLNLERTMIQNGIEVLLEQESELNDKLKSINKRNPRAKILECSNLISSFDTKIAIRNKTIEFYSNNDTCYTCHQEIQPEAKKNHICESQTDIETYLDAKKQLEEMVKSQTKLSDEADKLREKINDYQKGISLNQSKIQSISKQISECEAEIKNIESNSSSLDKELGKKEVFEEEHKDLKTKLDQLTVEVNNHDVVLSLLKDSGIKSQIVKKYLPIMNKFIGRYMSELEFPIHFELDSEFKETCKSPLYQDFSYESFSEGQKSRIDLSLMFTWREVGRLKNSVSCNLLILDEVFSSSLDEVGKDNLLRLLRYVLEDVNVVVVDHTLNETFKEKFDSTIEVKQIKGFSHYSN
ncbi:endonuclease [Synechococcus phage S-CRM01]|uniref:SbcC-like subunit of palindrome specific endonuclease n=1 Tax=Synechococcus phage S-CRM01 TaxID=1026955 RepID=UPI000209E361|nr:SbcC-like subunit of palindrome specific endonuclease [Synechococcus phage S-CRM01]AEC53002.1 endonuclease [Synechococcus phage S-CRM01]